MSKMTMSLHRHDQCIINNTVRRSMSSSECRRREVTVQMRRAAEDCSRSERRRLEKLGRRRLRVEYGEQTAHKTKRNADAFETPTLLDDEVHRRDMTVPGREDIYKQELCQHSHDAVVVFAISRGLMQSPDC